MMSITREIDIYTSAAQQIAEVHEARLMPGVQRRKRNEK